MSVLDGIAATAEQIVDTLGYLGLGLVMLVENVLPPVPSELVLPVVGLEVSGGQLLFWGAALAATVGSVLGALVLYALGRFGGRAMALRLPRFLGVTGEGLARAEARFALMTALGSLVWNTALIWLGTALASNWESVVGAASGISAYAVAAATGIGILTVMLHRIARLRRALRVGP